VSLFDEWSPQPVAWCPRAYRLCSPAAVDEDGHYAAQLAEALSDAQAMGHLCRQESASMLPVQALGVEARHRVLDICAAPGSKTLQLLDVLVRAGGAIPEGLLVANDSKCSRLRKLVDRVRCVPAEPLVVTCADARHFPELACEGGGALRYDRVLCDVPCSDGIVRKSRGILAHWRARNGLGFHETQLAILRRGLELLAPGGLLAYSTCALNPVECEAVVAAALSQLGDDVETVEVGVPGLCLEPGLTSWRVPATLARAAGPKPPAGGVTYGSWEDVDEEEKTSGRLRRSMFPPVAHATPEAAAAISRQLRRCGRLLPAHDDGGGFFLALLRRRRSAGTARGSAALRAARRR